MYKGVKRYFWLYIKAGEQKYTWAESSTTSAATALWVQQTTEYEDGIVCHIQWRYET